MGFISGVFGLGPVILFFVLSGYVLTKSLKKNLNCKAILAFLIRRLFRIYPMVLVSIILALYLSTYYYDGKDLVAESPALEFLLKKAREVRSWESFIKQITLCETYTNSPLWTIQVELACSVLIPIMIGLFTRFAIILLPSSVLLAFLITKAHAAPSWRYAPFWLFAFFIGYLAIETQNYFSAKTKEWPLWVLLSTALCFSALLSRWISPFISYAVFFGVFISSVVTHAEMCHKILKSRPLLFLGKISFGIYLIHFPVILTTWSIISNCFPKYWHAHSPLILIPILYQISLLPTIIISIVTYRFIEFPFQQIGHKISARLLD